MNISERIASFLADRGVRCVFMVTGGGSMFLNDAFGREARVRCICNLHEQACAMAAEGFARVSGMPGVVCTTSGPGGTNALTGVAGAWLDSIPMLVISGQVRTDFVAARRPELGLRQLGDQELNIVDMARPITKHAETIWTPADALPALERAWSLCQSGRPGPVWLDIPLDVQDAEWNGAFSARDAAFEAETRPDVSADAVRMAAERLSASSRPVVVAGAGVRVAKAESDLRAFVERLELPMLTTISGADLMESDHPLFFGRPGIMGDRAANLILQNADCLLVLGTRMGLRTIGYAADSLAPNAFKIMVDIDSAELRKPTFRPDLPIHADARDFLRRLCRAFAEERLDNGRAFDAWREACRALRGAFPPVSESIRNRKDFVSSYVLPERIAAFCRSDDIVVTGNGTAYTSTFQAMPLKRGMRLFANQGCASMGYDLPASIGAALAGGGRRVLCITGDGSIQMNLQELQTIRSLRLPVKTFVLNNQGYLSIRHTQEAFLHGRIVGADAASGVVLPDLERIAAAYELPFFRLRNHDELDAALPEILRNEEPVLAEVVADPAERLAPKAASRRLDDGTFSAGALDDMSPPLSADERAHVDSILSKCKTSIRSCVQ